MLTETGKQAINDLLQYLCPRSRSQPGYIEKLSGITRQTASKLLSCDPNRAVQVKKIEQVFKTLNQKIEEEYKGRNPSPTGSESLIAYEKRIKQHLNEHQRIFDQNLHCQEVTDSDLQEQSISFGQALSSGTIDAPDDSQQAIAIEGRLAELLWDLGCDSQQDCFRKNWKKCDRAAFISMRAPDADSQRWLAKRYAQKVKGFVRAKKMPIKSGSYHPMTRQFSEFWKELTKYLPGVEAEKDAVIEKLCELIQTQSVVIVLYGVDNHTKSLQAFRREVIQEFWNPLYQSLRQSAQPRKRFQLALFLVGDSSNRPVVKLRDNS